MDMWPQTGKLTRITVKNLFGIKQEIIIPLNSDIPTVLTGPNGSGKSTILKLVHLCGKPDLIDLLAIDFEDFCLEFEAGDSFRVSKKDGSKSVTMTWREHSDEVEYDERMARIPADLRKRLVEEPEDADRILRNWDRINGRGYEEYRLFRQIATEATTGTLQIDAPPWLEEFASYFPVSLISDRRLQDAMTPIEGIPGRYRSEASGPAIVAAATHIAETLRITQARYGQETEQVDRQLPSVVLQAMRSGPERSQEEVMTLAAKVGEKSRELQSVGLLDRRTDTHEAYLTDPQDEPAARRVVAAILQATLDRLHQLDEEHLRLGALKTFLDRRLRGKSILLGGRRGIIFESNGGRPIRPESLSSGEQHLVILAFDLIYATKKNSLVIIDEPEISLHVAWQDSLLDDLMSLGRARNVSFLMASHAPTIIAQMPETEHPLDMEWN